MRGSEILKGRWCVSAVFKGRPDLLTSILGFFFSFVVSLECYPLTQLRCGSSSAVSYLYSCAIAQFGNGWTWCKLSVTDVAPGGGGGYGEEIWASGSFSSQPQHVLLHSSKEVCVSLCLLEAGDIYSPLGRGTLLQTSSGGSVTCSNFTNFFIYWCM